MPKAMWPACIGLGLLCWTLIEYLLHRFLLHYQARRRGIRHVIDTLHLGHHRDPAHEAKITVPVYASLPIAFAVFALFRVVSGGWGAAAILMLGTIAGYLYYEAVHFRIHCGSERGWLIGWQRANHCFHHFKASARCFGVTTPLWDWVFRTGKEGMA